MKHEHFGDSCTLSHSHSVSEWFACVRIWPTLLSMFYGLMWNRGTDVKARVFTPTSTQYRYTKQSISTTCFSVGMRCTCTFLHAASVQWQKRRWATSGTDSKPNHIFQFCVGVTDSQPTLAHIRLSMWEFATVSAFRMHISLYSCVCFCFGARIQRNRVAPLQTSFAIAEYLYVPRKSRRNAIFCLEMRVNIRELLKIFEVISPHACSYYIISIEKCLETTQLSPFFVCMSSFWPNISSHRVLFTAMCCVHIVNVFVSTSFRLVDAVRWSGCGRECVV